jgi:hypothetical protein
MQSIFDESFYNHCITAECSGWDWKNDCTPKQMKAAWVSSSIFGIATYDDNLDVEFGEAILDVMRAINDGRTFEYIVENNGANYRKYILVCNWLEKRKMINWGTSIRGAWFDYWSKVQICDGVDFTKENLESLLTFCE